MSIKIFQFSGWNIFFSFGLVACIKSNDLGSMPAPEIKVNTANPTWNNGISDLVKEKCANCHTDESKRSKFVPANVPDTYNRMADEDFFTSVKDVVYKRVFEDKSNPMPPAFATPLTETEQKALKEYLKPGSGEDNAICKTEGSTSDTFETISGIFVTHCSGCHYGGSGRQVFSNIETVKANLTGMLSRLDSGSMPLGDKGFKTSEDGVKLISWLCYGADVNSSN